MGRDIEEDREMQTDPETQRRQTQRDRRTVSRPVISDHTCILPAAKTYLKPSFPCAWVYSLSSSTEADPEVGVGPKTLHLSVLPGAIAAPGPGQQGKNQGCITRLGLSSAIPLSSWCRAPFVRTWLEFTVKEHPGWHSLVSTAIFLRWRTHCGLVSGTAK